MFTLTRDDGHVLSSDPDRLDLDRAARGRGLGTWLAGAVRDHVAEFGVRRILLATVDAHGMYARVGFAPLADAHRWMQLDQQVSRVTGKEPQAEPPLTVEA